MSHVSQVLVVNGGVAAMEILACCLFDPGDVLLTPSPCYTRIFVNFNERFQVQVEDVFLKESNNSVSWLSNIFNKCNECK